MKNFQKTPQYRKILAGAVKLAKVTASLNTCPRASVGAVSFSPDADVTTKIRAHNGHPEGNLKCVIEDNHCVSSIHAEAALIAQAARRGAKLSGRHVVLTERPCQRCMLLMKEAGIAKVYYINDYHTKAHGEEFCSEPLKEALGLEQIYEPIV